MSEGLKKLADKLAQKGRLEEQEYVELLRFHDKETVEYLCQLAGRVQRKDRGGQIQVMGTVDLSSYCKNNCKYCGLRRDNRFARRYRMTVSDVLSCCQEGGSQNIHDFLIQGGDDLSYTPDQIADMIAAILEEMPGTSVFLALGEKSRAVYRKWREAGATGYILCHEAAEDSRYKKLHPANMSLLRRKQCLWELKDLGFIVGSGFMVGSPYQRVTDMAKEFAFLRQLEPQLLLAGPFLPAEGTPFENERNGPFDLTCFVLSLLRLILPQALLPVAQTLELVDRDGALHAVRAGADMLLPDLTPRDLRSRYHCYKKRLMRGNIGVEALANKRRKLQGDGYEIAVDGWGIRAGRSSDGGAGTGIGAGGPRKPGKSVGRAGRTAAADVRTTGAGW